MTSGTARADRFLACALAAFVLAVYTLTFQGFPALVDAEIEFQSTSALARTGSFALGGTPEGDALVAHARESAPGSFAVVPGTDGRFYAWYGPGQALVGVPFHFVGQWAAHVWPGLEARNAQLSHMGVARSEAWSHLLVGWRNPLLGALTAALVFVIARRLGASRRASMLAGLAYAFTTFAWAQACATLDDVQATFFAALAVDAVLALRVSERARATAMQLSIALSMMVLTRIALLPLAVVLLAAAWLARRGKPDRVSVAVVAGGAFAIALAWLAWFDAARFGSPFETGYGAAVRGGLFSGSPLTAFFGLLASPGRGLLWFAPAFVIGIVGARRMSKHGDAAFARLVLAAALMVFLPLAFLRAWHGAWTFGPRYMLPWLPIALGSVAIAIDRGGARLRAAAIALCVLGFAVQVPGVLVDTAAYHDLALQAASVDWPDGGLPTADAREHEEQRFERSLWSARYQPALVQARILSTKLSAATREAWSEEDSTQLFGVTAERSIRPMHERERGFLHLAWVDLHQRLGAPAWPGPLIAALLILAGVVLAQAGRRDAARERAQGIGTFFR
jgi:hypothetical protein